MRLFAIAAGILALLAAAQSAAGDVRATVSRMVLVPAGPGASLAAAPVYSADALPPPSFDVYIDPELNGQPADEYLRDRGRLMGARLSVWLYRFDEGATPDKSALPGPTLVIEPDAAGSFSFPPAALQPGCLYAWQAVAKITLERGSADLWSALLYFHLAPAEERLPALLAEAQRAALNELEQVAAEQQRAQEALGCQLKGLQAYTDYATASDTYLCAPLAGDDSCPMPDASGPRPLTLPRLMALGRTAGEAWRLKDVLAEGGSAGEGIAALGGGLYSTLERWAAEPAPLTGQSYVSLVEAANSLRTGGAKLGAAEAQSGLSQLLLALDGLVGPGTLELRPGYERAFLAYAAGTERRLTRAEAAALQFKDQLGEERSLAWQEAFREQRAQLEVLVSEVQRGRLAKGQLAVRLAQAAGKLDLPGAAEEFSYLEGAVCLVNVDRTRRLTAADAPQLKRLAAELARCHLSRFMLALWPLQP